MYDIHTGTIRTVFSATFDESMVRRRCNIRVYDKAREKLSIILPSGQSNGECRYWLLRSGDIQILFCGARNPRGTLLCMYETT